MSTSMIDVQRDIILPKISITGRPSSTPGQTEFKHLICDHNSRQILDNVAPRDDVLNCGVLEIHQIEDSRRGDPNDDGVYFLTPRPHTFELLTADIRQRRYRGVYVIWTSQIHQNVEKAIRKLHSESGQPLENSALSIDFLSRESHLISFMNDSSFQILFNHTCDGFIKEHLKELTRKILCMCITLDEYPLIRYYRPRTARHDAAVLCTHLAKHVQEAIDDYASRNTHFPPPSQRPRAVLLITDRSMDLMAPLVHELTYQAMAMDLVPMQEIDDKVSYEHMVTQKNSDQKSPEKVELNDRDQIWVENRHLHMKDLLIKLSNDFKKFQAKNSQFANSDAQNTTINTLRDMTAGLHEFVKGKEAFSLHIAIAEKCAKSFQDQKLLDITSVEQSLATGLDEDNRVPKNLADQLVRLLDDESVVLNNRARLLIMYIIYRGGILPGDIQKLLRHGELPDNYGRAIYNFESLGAKVRRELKDTSPPYQPLYQSREVAYRDGEEVSLSRFEPILRYVLEELCQGNLDASKFPPTKPHMDNQQGNAPQASLRSAGKPTWANTRPSAKKPRQRIMVFMAGGATYSEARACYEVSAQTGKEIFLATSHLLRPNHYLQAVEKLDQPWKAEDLKINEDWTKVLNRLANAPPQPRPPEARPPTAAMQNMKLEPPRPSSRPATLPTPAPDPSSSSSFVPPTEYVSTGKLKKKEKDKDKEKKHRYLGGILGKH